MGLGLFIYFVYGFYIFGKLIRFLIFTARETKSGAKEKRTWEFSFHLFYGNSLGGLGNLLELLLQFAVVYIDCFGCCK